MKRSSTWFALILILLASLPNVVNLASAESKQQRGIQHKAQTQPAQEKVQNQQSQVMFIPSSVLDSVVAALRESDGAVEQQAIAAQKQAEADKETWCSPSVIVNIVLAAIGFGYLIFMRLQWLTMEKQIETTREQIRAMMDAERPWIALRDRELTDWKLEADFPPRILFKFLNYGKGLCFMETTRLRLGIYEGNPLADLQMPAEPDYSDKACTVQKWNGIAIEPNERRPAYAMLKASLDQTLFDEVRHFNKTLVFYGVVEYRDAFKRRIKHGFCSVYLPPGAYGDQPIWNDVGGPDFYRYEIIENS